MTRDHELLAKRSNIKTSFGVAIMSPKELLLEDGADSEPIL